MADLKDKTIARLTRSVILLSSLVLLLALFIIGLLSVGRFQFERCGVKTPETMDTIDVIYCGNFYNQPTPLFNTNCASCHFINKDMTGPALMGAYMRMPYKGWFRVFITNEQLLIDAKDPYTLKLREKWAPSANWTWTHAYEDLTTEEILELERITD